MGYSSNDFEVYQQGETVDLVVSAFTFGDDRTQLNPTIKGGIFFKKFEKVNASLVISIVHNVLEWIETGEISWNKWVSNVE